MAGKGLGLQSVQPAMLRASRSGRTASGVPIREAIAEGAAGPFAAAGTWRRHFLIGPETRHSAVLVAAGLLAMAVGLLVYLTDRDPSHAALIPAVAALAGGSLFGVVGHWLPSFAHPFALSLFTAAVLPSRSAWRYGVCAAWCVVNVAFEFGQHPRVSVHLADSLRSCIGHSGLCRSLSDYFLLGTFDGADVAAVASGALAAAAVLRLTHRLAEKNHA